MKKEALKNIFADAVDYIFSLTAAAWGGVPVCWGGSGF